MYPESQDLLEEMITLIGTATNTVDRTEAMLGWINDQEAALKDKLEGTQKPRVYLAGNSDFLSTAGNAMYQSAMIEQAGGNNVAKDIEDTYWVETDYEQVLAWNPEYIILASDAQYSVEDVLSNPNLKTCEAVKNGCVYQLPGNAEAWDSPVPSGILGSIWLANVLHPEKLSTEECGEIINDYYEMFYEFTYGEI